MGIRLLRGRDILASDRQASPTVCLIDADFAARFFAAQDPIGQEIQMYSGWARIVGVVSAIRGTALEGLSRPAVYYSLPQVPFFPSAAVVVRAHGAVVPLIRQAVRQASPRSPIFDVMTMDERIGTSLGTRRVVVQLLGIFACITVLLSLIGLHSVVAQVVSERTPEIGLRMALGARPAQVLAYFVRRGVTSGLVGLSIGFVAAGYAQRWLASLLYEIGPFDTVSFVATGVGLLAMLVCAVWLPARRASKVDPQVALRYE
jgi:ABC-type antimicrobial peptide transport system permease subunit